METKEQIEDIDKEIRDLQEINTEPAQLDFFGWIDSHTSKEKGKSFYSWLSNQIYHYIKINLETKKLDHMQL